MEPQKTAAIVYNPTKVDEVGLRRVVTAEERSAGWASSLWLTTRVDDPGQEVTQRALAAGVDLVIAAGGDGTIRAVAEGLRDSPVPLAIVPAGTGNLLARNLALTLNDLPGAITTAFRGVDRPIDLGIVKLERTTGVTEHVFLVMTGLGIDARMLDETDPVLKKRVGWLAYARAITTVLRQNRQLNGRYRLDDAVPQNLRANTIMIGNCGTLPANILLLPDAAVDDGAFEVVLLRPKSVLGWLEIMTKVFWENGVLRRSTLGHRLLGLTREVRAVTNQLGTRIDLRMTDPHRVEIDGDSFGTATALRAEIVPEGLTVRVPQTSSPQPTKRDPL